MKLSRILTTFACGVCVPAFLLAGPQSSTAQPGQSTTSSQSSTSSEHQHGSTVSDGTAQDGKPAREHCNEAQTSLDKAWSMYSQLRGGADTSSSLGASPSSSSSATQPGSSTAGSSSSSTAQPGSSTTSSSAQSGSSQSSVSDGAAATNGAATWDSFKTQLDHARTHLRYCMTAMNQMHGGMMSNGKSTSTTTSDPSSSMEKDKNKPQP